MEFADYGSLLVTINYPGWTPTTTFATKFTLDSNNYLYVGGNYRTSSSACSPFILRYISLISAPQLNATIGSSLIYEISTNATLTNLMIRSDANIIICYGETYPTSQNFSILNSNANTLVNAMELYSEHD